MTQIKNSDVSAKEWYKNKLEKEGYKILERKHPVDIVAEKGGVKYYFELKSQNTNKNPYVGGVSLGQLRCALENEKYFRFVYLRRLTGGKYYCKELTLKDFLPHLSGNWKIVHNFSFKLKNPSTDHPEILENEDSLDADAVRKAWSEVKDPTNILK